MSTDFSVTAGGNVRRPRVAGQFYPASPVDLAKQIAELFTTVEKKEMAGEIMGLIVPHAGYQYSGKVAATAYKYLQGCQFESVIVMAPSHMIAFGGISAYSGAAYQTPIGVVPIDKELVQALTHKSGVIQRSEIGHGDSSDEHSIEVQLPFLQVVLGNFQLVPLLFGDQQSSTIQTIVQAITRVCAGRHVLLVASSDLSHYYPHSQAGQLDQVIIRNIDLFRPEQLAEDLACGKGEACGAAPMVAALLASKLLGANHSKVVQYATSGDVTGDFGAVVGYLSALIYKE